MISSRPRARDRIVAVAPHPDDDVLGCGGTLAAAAAAGCPVLAIYATDGAASHVGSQAYPPERLRDVREAEALAGLAELGFEPEAARFLREPDGALGATPESRLRLDAALRDGLSAFAPTLVLSPWRRDVHPDHVATSRAVRGALAAIASEAALLEYRIWGAPIDADREADVLCEERIDIASSLGAKRSALAAHRSQLGEIVADARRSFTLPADLVARALQPVETFYVIARSAWV